MYNCAVRLMLATLLCARWCMWTTSCSRACLHVLCGQVRLATQHGQALFVRARVRGTEGRRVAKKAVMVTGMHVSTRICGIHHEYPLHNHLDMRRTAGSKVSYNDIFSHPHVV